MNEQEVYKAEAAPEVHTLKGLFNIDAPTFDIEDIAHALGNICRYGGRCKFFYSVAEHSVLVAGLMAELGLGNPYEGLMHDASEAYVGDVPSPFKSRWASHLDDEHRVDTALRAHFNLPAEKSEGCHEADRLALFIEAKQLMWSEGADFIDTLRVRPRAMELVNQHWKVHGFDPKLARHLFLKAYKHYGPKIEVASANVEAEAARAASGEPQEGSSLVIVSG